MDNLEIRSFNIELRDEPESRHIEGYGSVFNERSLDLGGFVEMIAPGAFDGVIERSDVKCYLDHNPEKGILARSRNGKGSLSLVVDEKGLQYSFDAPHTNLGDEVVEGLKRGDYSQSSFAFTVDDEVWTKEADGTYLRTITKIGGLYDVSIVANPAYEGTQCVRFDSYSASNGVTGILTSPSVTITSPEAKVSFAVKNPKGGFLAAYVSTDGGSTYFNNPLDTFENLTEWSVKAYNLGSYVGQSVCIVFHSVSNWGSGDAYHYMDNFELGEPATCAKPVNVSISSVTQTTANLQWNLDTVGDASSSYFLTVSDEDGNYLFNNQSITVTNMAGTYSYALTGLTSGVTYSVFVKTDCSAAFRGFSEVSATKSFTTLCNPVNFPYTCDFDSMTTNVNPDCWTIYAPTTATSVSTTQKYGSSGKSLKLYATTDGQVLATTAPLNHAANDMEIDFMLEQMTRLKFS